MTKPLNILLVIHHNLNINAGAPGVTYQLAVEYTKLGHKVAIYSFDNLPARLPEKLKMLVFPYFLAWHIKISLRKKALDVVDASTGDSWVFSLLRNRKRRPLLVTRSHGLEHAYYQGELEEARRENKKVSRRFHLYHGGLRLWEVNRSLRRSDLSLLLNQDDLAFAVKELKVRPERVWEVPNGIPALFLNLPFTNTPTDNDSPLKLAFIGSYLPRKGIKYLAPALDYILRKYPQVSMTFLGTGASQEQILSDYAPELKERITAVPKFKHEELPSLLKDHQIKIFPTLGEGFSLALIEAMACGLAPIATAISGSKSAVKDGYNGLLVPVRDVQALKLAIERLINDRELLDYIRQNSYKKAQEYSWSNIAAENISLYEEFLQKLAL
jgi:glycosyltransferase involved in cell wall biosynthesis